MGILEDPKEVGVGSDFLPPNKEMMFISSVMSA